MNRFNSWNAAVIFASLLGVITGWAEIAWLYPIAEGISEIFMRLLQLVSAPLIFLSLAATLAKMQGAELRTLGRRVIQYTLLTTWIASAIALGLFVWVAPAGQVGIPADAAAVTSVSYWAHLKTVIPENLIEPFLTGNVMSVLFLAVLLSAALLRLPTAQREPISSLLSSLFAAVMEVARMILKVMPIAVWAFTLLFMRDVNIDGGESIGFYLLCVVLANLVQAFVVLPLLVWFRGGNPVRLVQAMMPGLAVAFFSKSSSAALPVVMQCAEERMGMSERTTRFAFPLCASVNMNACAAFILITVLFVSMSNGITFTAWELAGWTVMATLAAVGNAGVPMGCYMLSSAFLASMGVPLELLALILPVYSMIDMMESAINVWSDACVAHIVDLEVAA